MTTETNLSVAIFGANQRDGAYGGNSCSPPPRPGVHTANRQPCGVFWALILGALSVSAQPVVTLPPLTQFAWDGRSAIFIVTATGAAPLRYQWQFNGADMPGKTNRNFSLLQA